MQDARKFANDLRILAEFYESHPGLPTPSSKLFNVFIRDNAAERLRDIAKSLGRASKHFGDEWFYLRVNFGSVDLDFNAPRHEVCIRKVVATKEVPETVVPARVIPAHTEEIVEWDCDPILK